MNIFQYFVGLFMPKKEQPFITMEADGQKTLIQKIERSTEQELIGHWHEEVGELMQAINKWKRYMNSIDNESYLENLHEEIGDALYLTMVLREHFGAEKVDEILRTKTKERIQKHFGIRE